MMLFIQYGMCIHFSLLHCGWSHQMNASLEVNKPSFSSLKQLVPAGTWHVVILL